MKRWLLYAIMMLVLAAGRILPFRGSDVATLVPVEVIRIGLKQDKILLETDAGYWGAGDTVQAALTELQNVTPGQIFLDTADFLLIYPGQESLLPRIAPYLRPGCRVCIQVGEVALDQVAPFLRRHDPLLTLHAWQIGGGTIARLYGRQGRMELKWKIESRPNA